MNKSMWTLSLLALLFHINAYSETIAGSEGDSDVQSGSSIGSEGQEDGYGNDDSIVIDLPRVNLDGKRFCRVVKNMGGLFGQPKDKKLRFHCVSFKNGLMTDNANTFFGNPPETTRYLAIGTSVLIFKNDSLSPSFAYKIRDDGKLENSAGAVLWQDRMNRPLTAKK